MLAIILLVKELAKCHKSYHREKKTLGIGGVGGGGDRGLYSLCYDESNEGGNINYGDGNINYVSCQIMFLVMDMVPWCWIETAPCTQGAVARLPENFHADIWFLRFF